jgi:hypothetical protein
MVIHRKRKYFLLLVTLFTVFIFTIESVSACSVITASSMNSVFFGYNEDESEGDSTIHDLYLVFSPKNTSYCHEVTETYGHLFIMYDTNQISSPRVGMNMQGLAISGNGISEYPINPHPERLYYCDEYNFYNKVLEECSNVSEAINMACEFDFSPVMAYQMHIADANGDAVIIAPGSDGEVAFVQNENSSYLISTNFNRADSENKEYVCPRYEKAERELGKIRPEDDLKLDYIRSILDAIHYEGFETNTVFSQVFDLKNRISYLYYWHHYSEVVSLNLTQELTKGEHKIPLLELFSQEVVDNGSQEFQTNQTIVLGISLIAIITGVVFVVLLGISVRRTVKNSTLTTKWKTMQITIFLIGGAIGFSFLRTGHDLIPYVLAGNYLSNSGNIQSIIQEVSTIYLILVFCFGIIVVIYALIRKHVFPQTITSDFI